MKGQDAKNNNYGFTLIEMMVAIAVFSIVMVTALSALLNVIDANNKARSIKVAINNISLALEGISKDMRMGTDYGCSIDGSSFTNEGNCSTGGVMIRYRSPRADLVNGKHEFAYYKFEGTQIFECLEKGTLTCIGDTDFEPITSNEVTIASNSRFYVLGNGLDSTGLKQQPRMIMTVGGTAGTKAKTQTTFDLQTSISQRIRPQTTL